MTVKGKLRVKTVNGGSIFKHGREIISFVFWYNYFEGNVENYKREKRVIESEGFDANLDVDS